MRTTQFLISYPRYPEFECHNAFLACVEACLIGHQSFVCLDFSVRVAVRLALHLMLCMKETWPFARDESSK